MAGRSRRHVAFESSQRRDDIPVDRDRCVFETGVVHSAEEQVGGVAGGCLQTLLNDVNNNNRPTTLQTDKGSEFLNRPLQRLLKEYGVHHFATHNEETKASIAERFNRSLTTRMWRHFTKKQTIRYVDALQDFVRSYNNSYHRSIGMAPSAVNERHARKRCGSGCTGTTVVVRPSIESAIACASARRNVTSRKVTWRTGRKNCLRSSTRTVRIRPCIDWSTGTAIAWTAPSTNQNCRRSSCRQTRRIVSRRSCADVTTDARCW